MIKLTLLVESLTGSPSVDAPGQLEQDILRSIRVIVRGLRDEARSVKKQKGISPSDLLCLNAIHASQPVSQVEIARILCLQPPTVVGILDRLHKRGLVLRERSINDRRRMEVRLTAEGTTLVQSAPVPLQFQFLRALSTRSLEERMTIARSLESVAELMAPITPDPGGPVAPILSPETDLADSETKTTDL